MKRSFLLATLLLVIDGAGAAPVVNVRAPIAAQTFVDNLDTERPDVEAHVADVLVASLRQHFPVLDWQRGAAAPEAELILTLEERAGAGPKKEVNLRWSGRVGTESKPLAELPLITVYRTIDIPRAHDPDSLSTVLTDKVATWLGNSSNRKALAKEFMNLVPLAHSIEVDRSRERLVLPFSMTHAKMHERSTLMIRFVAEDQGAPQSGTISVSNLNETVRASSTNTLATVALFNYPAFTANGWNPRIEVVLRGARQSQVFLDDYLYSEAGAVSNGSARTP